MIKQVFAVVLAAALSVSAAGGKKQGDAVRAGGKQTGEVKADSMVYDQPTEWRVYSADGPAHAFAVQGNVLWLAGDAVVAEINMRGKKSDIQKIKALGSMEAAGISAIVIDRAGGVWFGGPNGLANKTGTQVTVYTADNGLADTKINALAVGQDGGVWAGTDNGANVYQAGSWKKYTTKEGLVSNKIQAILVDNKGNVWLGTDKGISVLNSGKWTSHTMKNGLSWNDTKAFGFDSKKGMLWAAVGDKDVNCWDGQKWSVYMEIQPGIDAIMVDSQSRIWVGSPTGLVKFNGDDWISDPKQLGIPGTQIFQMYCDDGGNLWYANENGVVRLANPYPY
jgi:ligand-binding sensor domain-containing protein